MIFSLPIVGLSVHSHYMHEPRRMCMYVADTVYKGFQSVVHRQTVCSAIILFFFYFALHHHRRVICAATTAAIKFMTANLH